VEEEEELEVEVDREVRDGGEEELGDIVKVAAVVRIIW
jgi:hypothetical protein